MAEVTEQIQTISNIPEWARPYATQLLGSVFGDPNRPGTGGILSQAYVPYKSQRIAGINPLQEQAFGDIAAMGVSPQLLQATGLAGLAGLSAGRMGQYDPMAPSQTYQAPQLGAVNLGYRSVAPLTSPTRYVMPAPERLSLPILSQYQMGPAQQVGADKFGTQAMQEYMSPYMEGVVERQKRGAIQDYLRQLPGIGAASARFGARGGTREALLESEARRGLSERLGDIEAQGLQSAYQQAAQQFGADRAAQMQAALANQAAGLTTGQQNLAAQLGVQQLGAGQYLQAQLANQQAMQQAQSQNLQAQINQAQFASQQALQAGQLNQAADLQAQAQALQQQQSLNQLTMQSAGLGAQYGLAGAQLSEQSRQFGAGLGLQGLQQQLAAAGQLGQLGQQQYQQGLGISQAQLGAGTQLQGIEQQQLANMYQDFINQQQYPYKQLEFASGILRGFQPTGQTSTLYQPPGSTLGQVVGVGAGLGGLFGALGSGIPTTGG